METADTPERPEPLKLKHEHEKKNHWQLVL